MAVLRSAVAITIASFVIVLPIIVIASDAPGKISPGISGLIMGAVSFQEAVRAGETWK
jgi:hypothetical protein